MPGPYDPGRKDPLNGRPPEDEPSAIRRAPGRVRAAGHELAVARLRPAAAAPDAPWLVFLHQGLGSMAQWGALPERLVAATGLPALLYDRWGFGLSEPLVLPRPDDYLDREALEALPEVLERCGVGRPLLVGHSDGATIALRYAAGFPDRPSAVVAIAPHVFVEQVTIVGIEAAVERWRSGDLARRLARHHGDKAEAVFRGWAETWLRPSFRSWRMTGCLSRIRCPLLLIQGEADEYGTRAQLDAIGEAARGPVEILMLPSCGHAPQADAPEAVVEAVARFVAALEQR